MNRRHRRRRGVRRHRGRRCLVVHRLRALPYAQHRILGLPLPFLTSRRLDAFLAIRPGERALEIGPGTGLQALHVAGLLGNQGRLDIQDQMLDHVMRRARAAGITWITPARADARQLPSLTPPSTPPTW